MKTKSTFLFIALLLQLPAALTASAQARWPFEYSVGQFSIHSDFDVAKEPKLLDQLGNLQKDLASTLLIRIHPEEIHLVLFEKQSNYQSYMREHFPEVPFRRALFIKRRGPGMVFAFKSHEMLVDLRHETTHALLNASLPYVPLWLDEGLAEYFESLPSDKERPHPHQSSVKRRVFWGQVPTIVQLEEVDGLADMGSLEYQQAWSFVHFMLHESAASKAVLIDFLSDLQAHSPPGQLSHRLSAELPDWKSRYRKHFRR